MKKPAKIFVCSVSDLFGDWVPREWIEKVLAVAKVAQQHTFIFLTKNPKRYAEFEFGTNCWLGTSITGKLEDAGKEALRIGEFMMEPSERGFVKFVSIEPLLGDASPAIGPWVDWVIVGGLTPKPRHEVAWVENIISACRRYGIEHWIPIFLKRNLNYQGNVREWPKAKIDYMEYDTDTKVQWAGRRDMKICDECKNDVGVDSVSIELSGMSPEDFHAMFYRDLCKKCRKALLAAIKRLVWGD